MFTVLSVTRNSIPRSFTRTTLFKQVRSNAKIGSSLSSTFSTSSPVNMSGAKQLVQKEIQDNFVMVFSKSYCPYCSATKKLFSELESKLEDGKKYKVIELDQIDEGSDIQAYIAQEYGQRTVPQVFINQEFIGGNSDVQALKGEKLNEKLKAAKKA
ncbi:hypothetical protein NliqN6_4794 [Naganishia liquefaciens]|uniref:glutathione peroxidase n=1 Tax=Naganishia liquefaciens TaxID=104408 RepID=A0A8H3YHP3_9TREE|nr:hypothetical protein NliqN6_4794 [Naganishia liquefaciens]